MSKKPYPLVALGGTFDHFHAGHRHFINFAWQLGEKLCLGLTRPELIKNKVCPSTIENYETRLANLKQFCQAQEIEVEIRTLSDVYGPTIDPDYGVEALVVTEATASGAKAINQKRGELGLAKLPVHVCPLLRDETGRIISSERIRLGEINPEGLNFAQVLTTNLRLHSQQRQALSQPQGPAINQPQAKPETPFVAVVGDSSLEQFIENGWSYDLGIYDYRQQREAVKSRVISQQTSADAQIKNPAGTITTDLTQKLKELISKILSDSDLSPQHLFVEGEEDLAAVALILLSPLQSKIYYGQPNQALIEMSINLKLKEAIYQLLASPLQTTG